MTSNGVSQAGLDHLKIVARRPRGNMFPVPGLKACVADGLVMALERRGLAAKDEQGIYRITDAGRAAISAETPSA